MRPIAELMFNDFIGFGLDPILNQGAKMRYMFGGKAKIPLVVRTVHGAGGRDNILNHCITCLRNTWCKSSRSF